MFSGLNNNITIADNLRQDIITVKLTYNTANFPIRFKTKFTQYPEGILPIYCVAADQSAITASPYITWSYSNGTLSISDISGLTIDKTYTLKILVIYE